MKKIIPYIFLTALFILSISCNQKKDNYSKNNPLNNKLKIIIADPVETLDPLKILYDSDWKVASNLYEGLVAFGDSNNINFELVDSINISTDNLVYSIKLKENIYFHDSPCFPNGKGRKLNSSDVYFTFSRLSSKENNFHNLQLINNKIEGIEQFYTAQSDSISGIQLIDSLRLKIKLKNPFSSFLNILAAPNFYIVPKEAINYYKDNFESNPVGTGPFRISQYKKYEKITLVKNENYHKYDNNETRLPYLKSIEYRTIDKTENAFGELLKKRTNFIQTNRVEHQKFALDSNNLNKFTTQELDKGVSVRFWGFYFLEDDYTEIKKLIRQEIIENFYKNYSDSIIYPNKKAETLVPPNLIGLNKSHQKIINFDNYTYKNLNFRDTVSIMANLVYKDLLIIEKVLKELKIPFKRIIKPDNYYGEIANIKPTIFRVSMVPSFPDPIEYYSLFYSKTSSNMNLSNFKNSYFDEIYEYVQTENNLLLKNEAYLAMEEILEKEYAVIYLSHQGSKFYVYSNNLKNIKFRYIIPDFRETYFE